MKFEFLPNEILMECFEYLNPFEIFYSFDRLNSRFNKCIRNFPLHLNFEHIRKRTFDYFCTQMVLNTEMKQQIYSLKLSNLSAYGQIEIFLSFFSINEFFNLRNLTLIRMTENDIKLFKSMLPLIPQLHSYHLLNYILNGNDIPSVLPIINLRRLSVPIMYSLLTAMKESSSITHLSVLFSSLLELYYLFQNTPMLKYLNIKFLNIKCSRKCDNLSNNVINCTALNLKQLIINSFSCEFNDFEMLVKQTPNLNSLTINASYGANMADADRWERLITTSLPCLTIFKFKFNCLYKIENDAITKFNQFQTDFWQKEHHWYIEYCLSKCRSAIIYTIPYISDVYDFDSNSIRYDNKLMDNSMTFDNVRELKWWHELSIESYQYYFSNITSLSLMGWRPHVKTQITIEHIQHLKIFVNLSNLKKLYIADSYEMNSSAILLEIFKETTQLSSLSIDSDTLISVMNNHQLCGYLNKMIKKINIFGSGLSLLDVKKFCEIFSNIEIIECHIHGLDNVLFLLNHLPKLSNLCAVVWSSDTLENCFSWFEIQTRKLNLIFHMYDYHKNQEEYRMTLRVWIDHISDSLNI